MFSAARSGTTVTFVIIDGWVVTVASVGDSRCILESAEGSVYFLSADHRLDANEEEYVLTPKSKLSYMITISLDL
jgi:serine/threonine protein phosphatase PrpC